MDDIPSGSHHDTAESHHDTTEAPHDVTNDASEDTPIEVPDDDDFADVPADTSKQVPKEEPTDGPSIPVTGTRRKIKAIKRKAPKDIPLDDSTTFLDYDSDEGQDPVVWEKIVKWELVDSELGEGKVNVITRQDGSTKPFLFLSQILHMVDKQDLLSLYDWVTKYYQTHSPDDIGMYLMGDLQILCDSYKGNSGVRFQV